MNITLLLVGREITVTGYLPYSLEEMGDTSGR
jgi:hypothetical protein